jgi:hypothetical protein
MVKIKSSGKLQKAYHECNVETNPRKTAKSMQNLSNNSSKNRYKNFTEFNQKTSLGTS